jgi:hypothetical protein
MVKPVERLNPQAKQACIVGALTGLARRRWSANVETPFVRANLVGEGGFEATEEPEYPRASLFLPPSQWPLCSLPCRS